MKLFSIFVLLSAWLLSAQAAKSDYNIFCYWDGQSNMRKYRSVYQYWDVNTKFCTHLVYGSTLGLDPAGSGNVEFEYPEEYIDFNHMAKYKNLKNVQIKSIISIGNWRDQSSLISEMISDTRKRDQFYTSLIGVLYKTGVQGVQINWQFPAHRHMHSKDRENFVTFLHELKIVLDEHKFMLMVAVSARLDEKTLAAYDIPSIMKYADFVSLLVHNHQDPYSRQLSYNAPLSGDKLKSVESCVAHWVKHSKMPSKLLLAIPLFGQTYTMASSNTTVGSASKGPGRQQQASLRPGYTTFGEFCTQSGKWQRKFDNVTQVPYAYKDDQWISYEDGRSISAKTHVVEQQHLGGVLVMSLDADDTQAACGERFALLRVIISVIGDPDSLTTQAATTESTGLCPRDGFFRNMWECDLYYECRDTKRFDYECVKGYYFDEKLGECQPASQVECKQNFVTWRPGQKLYNFKNLPLNLKIVQ
ncbi:probable chitinase 10 [Drosophila nasuta]|uniref:probable chitinase 10 n=1 Tax=Drosophila nasuta TaxID=42062 RepID=UPI00295E98E5|nr:probable chitinase 10 [Drosophila nasuta]